MIPLFDKKQISSSSLGALKLVPLGYLKMLSMILVSRIHKSSYLQLCCRGIEWASLKSFMSYSYPKPGASGLVKNEIFLLDIPSGRLCSLVCVWIVTHWILHVGGNIALSVALLRKWTVSSIEKKQIHVFLFSVTKRPGPVFIKHHKSNVYVTLNAIGSFWCNLCSHWLIQIFIN